MIEYTKINFSHAENAPISVAWPVFKTSVMKKGVCFQ
jgi:hypothetical protein